MVDQRASGSGSGSGSGSSSRDRALLGRLRRALVRMRSGRRPAAHDRLETRSPDAAGIRAMEEARVRSNGWNIGGSGWS